MHITELHLETANPALLRDFYTFTLGLPLVEQTLNSLTVQAGHTRITFNRGGNCRYHLAFNIPDNHYVEAKAWMLHRIPLLRVNGDSYDMHSQTWNSSAFYFFDTAGNVLECIARHDLANSSVESFGPHAFLNVSEIGLATDNVPELVQILQSRFKLPVFDGADSDTFTALGDENGLFIVVKRGRIWHPDTGIPSELYPTTVIIRGERSAEHGIHGHPYRIISRPSTRP